MTPLGHNNAASYRVFKGSYRRRRENIAAQTTTKPEKEKITKHE